MRTFFIYLFLEYKKSAKVLLKSTVSLLLAAVLLAAALYAVYVLPVSAAAVPAVYMLLLSFPAERNMKKYMKGLEAEDADQWYLE